MVKVRLSVCYKAPDEVVEKCLRKKPETADNILKDGILKMVSGSFEVSPDNVGKFKKYLKRRFSGCSDVNYVTLITVDHDSSVLGKYYSDDDKLVISAF